LLEESYADHSCRFVSYSPEQYLAEEGKVCKVHTDVIEKLEKAKVVINSNFYMFADVQLLPCGTPLGPVISDGNIVRLQSNLEFNSEDDMTKARWNPRPEAVKAADVLVMYKTIGAFTIKATQFDNWFLKLTEEEQANVNAVTGHVILQDGRPVDRRRAFISVGLDDFWNGKNARTVVGIQYSDVCNIPGGVQVKCGNMLILLQFEKKSSGSTVMTFFANSSMSEEDRPASLGVTLPEVQEILQFMMIDTAINFDGSGSSSLWTSIGDRSEKRSQPSDWTYSLNGQPRAYQFRPSPTLIAFVHHEADGL
jgi:hypothetical protein